MRLAIPLGLGPFALPVAIVTLVSPCVLKTHIMSIVGMESLYCQFDGAFIDAAIGVR